MLCWIENMISDSLLDEQYDFWDILEAKRRGCTIILCPRSNLHISRQLPDVAGMLERGIPLAIGTDSLASSPDLDPLAEAALLHKRFPEIDPAHWVQALCAGGPAQPIAMDYRGLARDPASKMLPVWLSNNRRLRTPQIPLQRKRQFKKHS